MFGGKLKQRGPNDVFPEHLPPSSPKLFWEDICTFMFIVAVFIVVKIWKQPKYLRTDEFIKKLMFIYTLEYYLTIRQDENSHAIFWDTDGTRVYHDYWNQSEGKGQIKNNISHIWI